MNVEEATAALRQLAQRVSASELLAAAVADGVVAGVPRPLPIDRTYPTGEALLAAIEGGKPIALAAALRGLARMKAPGIIGVALALIAGERALAVAAAFALAHSTEDACLEHLLTAFDPKGSVPRGALDRSVHPSATFRIRAVLDASGILSSPSRPRPTFTEWLAMSETEQEVIRSFDVPKKQDPAVARGALAIVCLGVRRVPDALETILRLFDEHPDDRVRQSCAHALGGWDDPRAVAAIDRRCDDFDDSVATICIKASLARDPRTAYDRFAPRIEATIANRGTQPDDAFASTLFWALHGGVSPRNVDPSKDPLVVDTRFAEAVARARHHRVVGAPARMVLGTIDRPQLLALVERFPRNVAPRENAPLPARRDYLARYRAGEYAAWDELVEHAAAVLQHADLHEEASAVAHALMMRVRECADAVRATLTESGATLATEEAPGDKRLERLRMIAGPLPIALEAFWRSVGSIALIPGGKSRYSYGKTSLEEDGIALLALDPLEIAADFDGEIAQHEENVAASHAEVLGPLMFTLAPDFLHKQKLSGGGPYCVELPPPDDADHVDPRVLAEARRMRLVGYLRACFDYGGFPMLELASRPQEEIGLNARIAWKRVPGSWAEASARLRQKLRRNVIPF